MSDVEWNKSGERFHRSTARSLNACVCADTVDQPNGAICCMPGSGGIVRGDWADCFGCKKWPQSLLVEHGLNNTPDGAAGGLKWSYSQPQGDGSVIETVHFLKTFNDLVPAAAGAEYVGPYQCQWRTTINIGRVTDSTDYLATDPEDIFEFSFTRDGTGYQFGIFDCHIWVHPTRGLILCQTTINPISFFWRRHWTSPTTLHSVSLGPAEAISWPVLGEDTARVETYTQYVENNLTRVCGDPSTFSTDGDIVITPNDGVA